MLIIIVGISVVVFISILMLIYYTSQYYKPRVQPIQRMTIQRKKTKPWMAHKVISIPSPCQTKMEPLSFLPPYEKQDVLPLYHQ